MVSAFHLHNIPRNTNDTSDTNFVVGSAEHSSYTQIQCELHRKADVVDYASVVHPDVNEDSYGIFPDALISQYIARITQESTPDNDIITIQPEELTRFYERYNIVKDQQYRQPVTRNLQVEAHVVQISAVFLAFASIVALLILLGLINYAIFVIRHHRTLTEVPQSKLDWMVQSIKTEDRPPAGTKNRPRRCVTAQSAHAAQVGAPAAKCRREEFEVARYRRSEPTTWHSRDSMATTEHGGSPAMSQGLSPQFLHGGKSPQVGPRVVSSEV